MNKPPIFSTEFADCIHLSLQSPWWFRQHLWDSITDRRSSYGLNRSSYGSRRSSYGSRRSSYGSEVKLRITGGQITEHWRSSYGAPEVMLRSTRGQVTDHRRSSYGAPEVKIESRRCCRNHHSGHRNKRIQSANSVEKLGYFIKILKFTEPSLEVFILFSYL